MKIFIVENNYLELSSATMAVIMAGHEAIRCQSYFDWELYEERKPFSISIPEGVDGVITDLMFHTSPYYKKKPETPSGLLVVIEALSKSIPVVVCTAGADGSHHSEDMSWIFDGFVKSRLDDDSLPFGWEEHKDWEKAIKLLEQIHAKQEGGDK